MYRASLDAAIRAAAERFRARRAAEGRDTGLVAEWSEGTMARPARCCDHMQADGYCETHNPLGGSYAAIRADLEANPPAYRPGRQRIQHEGVYGTRYRRPRMDRRPRSR